MAPVVDWNELWRVVRLASPLRGALDEFGYWERRASRFDGSTMWGELTERQMARIELKPEYTVLDVGAGTGRLTIPIAKRVRSVTAVEPSGGMLARLREKMEREGVKNVVCVNKRWEEVELGSDVGPHDLVIASHSLVMLDLRGALEKMNAAAKRRVYLFTFAGRMGGEGLWTAIYGEKYKGWETPDYLYAYNILHDMGIYANVEIFDFEYEERYTSLEEAVARFKEVHSVPPEREEALREYLSGILVSEGGALRQKRRRKVAMVWWRKEG
ncbi:MAG: class I SAM-dependent methyltransferase [Hadesarchaea archaeon]|nr:MAG: class I SAM-dependent methyltransferase [Hadesarchaea archaeon]